MVCTDAQGRRESTVNQKGGRERKGRRGCNRMGKSSRKGKTIHPDRQKTTWEPWGKA